MFKKIILFGLLSLMSVSCISTKSSIKNVDSSALKPVLKDEAYIIKEYAKERNYGYDQDYPINIGYILEMNEEKFIKYYFNGLVGPKGETLSFKKTGNCCPFPTINNKVGGGMLSLYEVTWQGQKKPVTLYFNIYERGAILCPFGLTIKNNTSKSK